MQGADGIGRFPDSHTSPALAVRAFLSPTRSVGKRAAYPEKRKPAAGLVSVAQPPPTRPAAGTDQSLALRAVAPASGDALGVLNVNQPESVTSG